METMRFRETKKSSYTLQIFSIVLFLVVGSIITYFAICNEKEPVIIGQNQSDITVSSNINESNALAEIEEPLESTSGIFKVTDKTTSDKTNKKIKANITVPVIKIKDEALTNLNDEIYNKFNDTYKSFKELMKDADNNFTYTVTYKVYDNIIGNKNILSITIHERMIDDSASTESMEKIHTYNIDLKDGLVLDQEDVALDALGRRIQR